MESKKLREQFNISLNGLSLNKMYFEGIEYDKSSGFYRPVIVSK
jgi:hypothetical protein